LEEAKEELSGDTAAQASGLLIRFQAGTTFLGLQMSLTILAPLENLNKALQSSKSTVTGALEAVSVVDAELGQLRCDEKFNDIFSEATDKVEELRMAPISLPRRRQPPPRFSGSTPAHHSKTAEEHYRRMFFECIDTARQDLKRRFDTPDLRKYDSLEKFLIGDSNTETIADFASEFDLGALRMQLQMFQHQFPAKSTLEAASNLRQMTTEVRRLFPQVERLVRLLLVSPASSCVAERSFSGLRRLLTWLRNSMSQERLNHVEVCHTHQELLDALDLVELAKEFASRSDYRMKIFGKY
jgi:hypothetical protein